MNYQIAKLLRYSLIMILVAFAATAPESAFASKLDPYWSIQQNIPQEDSAAPGSTSKQAGSMSPLGRLYKVMIKTTNAQEVAKKITEIGGEVRTVAGRIITATVTQEVIEEAMQWPEVEYIEAAKPIMQLNDRANADTGVVPIHAGTRLPQAYDGTGVIVGIIDSGIDIAQDEFLDPSGNSRILAIWDQGNDSGIGPAEIVSTYGTEFDADEINARTINHEDTDGHGSHVAGTAAGRAAKYGGVAPGASLIVVKYKLGDTVEICDAANYIFQKAAKFGMPAVINMSVGTSVGPHDGTSLVEECMDGLLDASQGRAIVAAAGNAGVAWGGNHIGAAVDGGVEKIAVWVPTAAANQYFVDMWENPDCAIDVKVVVYSNGFGYASPYVPRGNFYTGSAASIGDLYIDRTETVNSNNGKAHTMMMWVPGPDFNVTTDLMLLQFMGTCSDFHAWTGDYAASYFEGVTGPYGVQEYLPGDNVSTVMSPATAASVIAVGAYVTREGWTDILGNAYIGDTLEGELGEYSGWGPALNTSLQGFKPTITAPGSFIISTLSFYSKPDDSMLVDTDHVVMAGTSMAAPHVAGIIALMLELHPELTYDQITEVLQETGRSTAITGTLPNAQWGYGKVSASAAINELVSTYMPDFDPDADEDVDSPAPSPSVADNSSGGGCTLAADSRVVYPSWTILMSFGIIAVTLRRFIKTHAFFNPYRKGRSEDE